MQEFTPLEYIKIGLANHLGFDKLNFDQRLVKAEECISILSATDFNQEFTKEFVSGVCSALRNQYKEVDEPYHVLLAMRAHQRALKGLPTGYMVSLDMTSSGSQILAMLSGDYNTGKLCNLVGKERVDLYTAITKAMGMESKYPRSTVKKAIMTSLYNSKAKPKEVFGEDVGLYYKTLNHCMTRPCQIMKYFDHHKEYDSEGNVKTHFTWVMPDGFHCETWMETTNTYSVEVFGEDRLVEVTEEGYDEHYKAFLANYIHSFDSLIARELVMRTSFTAERIEYLKHLVESNAKDLTTSEGVVTHEDAMVWKLAQLYEKYGFLSSRVCYYLNVQNVGLIHNREALKKLVNSLKPRFDVLTIHDCFKCHPNHCNDMRKTMIEICADLTRSNCIDILGKEVPRSIPQLREKLAKAIENSDYIIC